MAPDDQVQEARELRVLHVVPGLQEEKFPRHASELGPRYASERVMRALLLG